MKKTRDPYQNKKRFSYKFAQCVVKLVSHRPKYKFLGEEIGDGPWLMLCNHAGKKSPTKMEVYFPHDYMFWGTYEMTLGLKGTHKYLTTTYYHQKRHLWKPIAWLIGTIVCPLVNWFYAGMRIIPTYQDGRFMQSIKDSMKILKEGKGLLIFPENSSQGYFDEITSFHPGFVMMLDLALRQGLDLSVYVSFFQRKKNRFVFDKPIKYSQLKEEHPDKDELIEYLRQKMNSLASIE